MGLVSRVPVLEPMEERIHQCHGLSTTVALMESASNSGVDGGGEIGEEEEEKVYVAVGKYVKESKSVLLWALQHLEGRKICVLHVHQPAQMIPLMGGKFEASKVKDEVVKAYRDLEKEKMHNLLNEYLRICNGVGVQAEELDIDRNNIEEGIVSLIAQHGIKRLVMGAAADKHYNKRMTRLKSKKAAFVNQHADASCDILFVCNKFLICSRREASLDGRDREVGGSPLSISSTRTVQRGHLKSISLPEGLSAQVKPSMLQALFHRFSSHGGRVTTASSLDEANDMSVLQEQLPSEGCVEGLDRISSWSLSDSSAHSTCSSSEEVMGSLESLPLVRYEGNEDGLVLHSVRESQENLSRSSPFLEDGRIEDEKSNKLHQAREEAKHSRREAFEESVRRRNAEKDAIEAKHKAKISESLYADEARRRRKMAETLARETFELNKIKSQLDKVVEELKAVSDQKSALEAQIANSNLSVKEMEGKILLAVDLVISYREERDQLLLERDNIDQEVEDPRKRIEEDMVSSQRPQSTPEFSFKEIEEATCSFDPSLMIGGGGYGSVYRGFLQNTEVAIKLLHSDSKQGRTEFQQEVDVLGRMRHPNLVTLIGACPEAWSLIYEYLPNGSLEDRLNCKDNTPPLPWQRRICIAVEVCSALIFLHSDKPDSVIHGDIKPANILLDANFVSKVGDFGICRLVSKERNSTDTITPYLFTDHPRGTPGYMDPEFLSTGELTVKSDVFSFGMVLLRLLTGRQAFGLVKEVHSAIEKGILSTLLDPTAGDWPYVQAKQLAHLALSCCEMSRKNRPDLKSEVWSVLEPMKASCGTSLSSCIDDNRKVPSYFICPISQEIMRDPHIAADGFTYEAKALKAWLDGGHNTSPMTNLELAHSNLIPNYSLRSAIEEWQQKPYTSF